MRIQVSKKLPSVSELVRILKSELPTHYSCKPFGIGKKTILIGRSTLVGAEVSINKNHVSISSSPPSVFASFLLSLAFAETVILLLPIIFGEGLPGPSKYLELEKEIGLLIRNMYQ